MLKNESECQNTNIEILYEDISLIVAVKPPKMPSQPDKTGDMDMLTLLYDYTGTQSVGMIHRLDRPVGGIMIFAKNKQSTVLLSEQIQKHTLQKTYYAVLCGVPKTTKGTLCHYIIKNNKSNVSKIVTETTSGSKKAVLEYNILETVADKEFGSLTLVKINLVTGRHHQIRVQFSAEGLALWGDNKYNTLFMKKRGWFQIALWSGKIAFEHPTEHKDYIFYKEPTVYPFSLFHFNTE